MTVCIAALCNIEAGNPIILAVSDRMITIANREFEPDQTKLVYFAERTVALLSGDMHGHAEITPMAFRNLAQDADPTNVTVLEVAEAYAKAFATCRRKKAERQFLTPLCLDSESFLSAQKDMLPSEVSRIHADLQGAELDATAIITGVDRTGGHIFLVADPGDIHSFDMSSFCAIGSGDGVALSQFQSAGYEKRWPATRALFLLYASKRRAEAAAGVGLKTDLVMIQAGHPIRRLTEAEIKLLEEIYQEKVKSDDDSERVAVERLTEEVRKIAERENAADASAKSQEILEGDAGVKDQIASEAETIE